MKVGTCQICVENQRFYVDNYKFWETKRLLHLNSIIIKSRIVGKDEQSEEEYSKIYPITC